MKQFFISYTGADERWATWIDATLKGAGYSTIIQAVDFGAGSNFITEMRKGIQGTERMIAVFSPEYFQSKYAMAELQAAFLKDPIGEERLLVPVRVKDCVIPDLFRGVVYIDLVALDEDAARGKLLSMLEEGNAKPATPPAFPGKTEPPPDDFPGPRNERAIVLHEYPSTNLQFTTYKSIRDSGENLLVELSGGGAEFTAFMESLRKRKDKLGVAYGTKALLTRVVDVTHELGDDDVWTLELRPEDTDYGGGWMEPAYQGLSSDQIAEMRCRRILLDEKQPEGKDAVDGALLEVFLQGFQNPLQFEESPFPRLYQRFKDDIPMFLSVAPLVAIYSLRLNGVIEHVLKLTMELDMPGTLRVDFKGRRARKYSSQEPHVMTVEGTCDLEAVEDTEAEKA